MDEPGQIDQTAANIECLSVLGLAPPVSIEDVKQAYLDKVKTAHPDRGGDAGQFRRLHEAFEQATEYARFKAGRLQWLGQWVEQYAEQQKIIGEILALGGRVEIESVDWLARSIGPDFATVLDRVIALELVGPQFDDPIIAQLSTMRVLSGLRELKLAKTRVSETGLAYLHSCQGLRDLDLTGTQADVHAIRALIRDLPGLATLVLTDTGIGWWSRTWLRLSNRGLTVRL